ncbi:hypothetical protein [Halobacteriovorax marinus]|uniref:hypothetical protein n=1 Tax=Halobacteriovorax marinus TaxID=97084 RepID=UPI003A90D7E7
MKFIKILIIALLSLSLAAQEGSDYSVCEDQAISFYQDVLAKDESNILGKQFELTTLKLARMTISHSRPSLEDAISKLSKSIDKDDPKLKHVQQMYKQYGYEKDLDSLMQAMESASYWNKDTRFYNDDVSAFILLAKETNPEAGLDERDAAITWFMSYVGDKASDKFGATSATRNLTNLSSRLSRFTGAYKENRSLTDSEIKSKIDELESDISVTMKALHRELVIELGAECFNGALFGGACAYTDDLSNLLYSQALMDLSDDLKKNRVQGLEEEVFQSANKYQLKLMALPSSSEYLREKPINLIPPKIDYSSVADIRIHDEYWINREDITKLEDNLNLLSDKEKIKAFEQHAQSGVFFILNKEDQTLEKYDANGDLLSSQKMDLEGLLSDEKQLGGAGNYFIHSIKNGVLYLQDDRGNVRPYHGVDVSNVAPGASFYILPQDRDHHFKIKGGKLHFTTKGRKSDYLPYNFSKRDTSIKEIRSVITNKDYQTKTAVQFMGEIDSRKSEITKLYNLTDHEYNELSKLAFGILGNESQFGESSRYHVKEALPWLVAIAKGNGTNTSMNSRGPTQIKKVPPKIAKKYGVTKENLTDPKKAAVATMGFLAQALDELKAKERFHPDINADNRFDYIHYIYMGKSREITKATATPMKNIYFKQILNFNKGLEVYEKIE